MKKGTVQRLVSREYGPLIAWVAAWLIVGATVGHADAIRLLAAIAFVRCARYLTGPTSAPLLRSRMAARGKVHGPARRTVMLVEATALVASAVVLTLIIQLLLVADQQVTAGFCLILATTLPVKALLPLAAGRRIEDLYQPLVSVSGLLLAMVAWAVDGSLISFVIAFAAREWIALGIAFAVGKHRDVDVVPPASLGWRDVADHSHASARRRFTYRVSKNLLKFVLGPFGVIAARTGRGFRMDRKLERFVPRSQWALGVLTLGLIGAGVAMILVVPKPALLVAAATMMRIGASAGNILIWSALGSGDVALPDDDDDDD